MGIFSSSQKTLTTRSVDDILKRVKSLDALERAYIKGLFVQYKANGISKLEVEEAVKDMIRDTSDEIDPKEAAETRDALLAELNPK